MKRSPLLAARLAQKLTLVEVCRQFRRRYRVNLDTGNLSRIERDEQTPSLELASRLAAFYQAMGEPLDELQILYPRRRRRVNGDAHG